MAAAAACCVDLQAFSWCGAYQPLPGRIYFLVAGARNWKKIRYRRGEFRVRYFPGNFYKSRGVQIPEFGLSFTLQPESYKPFCSSRRLSDGLGNVYEGGRRSLATLAAVATGAADWESRWEGSQENRRAEIWRIWNFKPTSSGERMAVLGILALTGLVVIRLLRGSSLLSVGAIILFLFVGRFHHRLKPAMLFLSERLQNLKGNFIRSADQVPISFKRQTSGTAADNLLYSLFASSPLLSAPISSVANGTSGRGKLIYVKDVAKTVNHLTSIIQNLGSGVNAEDVQSVNDLLNLHLGITELREELYRAASALHAKESLLLSKLASTEERGTDALLVRVPSGEKVGTNSEPASDNSGRRELMFSSDFSGEGGVDMILNYKNRNVVNSDSSGFNDSQQAPRQSSNDGPARDKIFQSPSYQVINADFKLDPVALETQATARSFLTDVAASEIDGDRGKLMAATESLQVSSHIPKQMVSESLPDVAQGFTLDTAKQPDRSRGDSIEVKTGFPQERKETVIEKEFVPPLEAQSHLSVNRIVAEEPMTSILLEKGSTDPWQPDDCLISNSVATDENEDSHWVDLVMQETATASPSGRWTDHDNDNLYVNSIRKGVAYRDGGGKGRKPSSDFWSNNTANAGRAERATLTRIKATRRGSLGSVGDVDNDLPQKRSGSWEDGPMSQGLVRRGDSAEGAGQQTKSGKLYVQDEPELWDTETEIDEPSSSRLPIRRSLNYQESERDLDVRKVSAGDREWSYDGRGSQNKNILEEERDYRNGMNPDSRYYSQKRTRPYNAQIDTQMRNQEEEEELFPMTEAGDMEEEYFGSESRNRTSNDVDPSQTGEDMGGNYSSQMNMRSKVPIDPRNTRQRVEEVDEEDDVVDDDGYRREARNLEEEDQDYASRRKNWAESQYPGRNVQRGSDYDYENERRNLPQYVQNEIEPEERNLPARQPSRLQLEKFDRLLDEGEALLEEGMQGLEGRIEVGVAESMLYEAANLFEAASEIDPSSLIAVGFWGNTLLVHGELKLKLSQQLRSMLPSSNSYSMMRARDDQRESLEQTLQSVSEECEELLVDAGRKYRMALSLDRTDMRALYNWGLALCYRGQLIADEGGERAIQDADKVYLAAIDKFEAMLGISQEYAAGAVYNWGLAMRDRARLRPMGDRDRVKLLLQAKELFQDSVRLDPNNGQARGAVAAAVAELEELKRFGEMQSERKINGISSRSWWE